jgi:hypothetical protein
VMGVSWAARAGLNYVAQQLATSAATKKSESDPPAPSPLEKPWETKR